MMKKMNNTSKAISFAVSSVLLLILIMSLVACSVEEAKALDNTSSSGQLVKLVETPPTNAPVFDTNALNNWCNGEDKGTIRMVEGFPIKHNIHGWYIEDGCGNEWLVDGISLSKYDFLLLWIVDNNTPNDVTDDSIIKVWREAH